MGLVKVDTAEDLKVILGTQQIVSQQAVREATQHAHLPPKYFIDTASKVLEKYARYPTLTEYQMLPALADAETWGATFGVTAIIGALVLDHAKLTVKGESGKLDLLYTAFLEKLRGRGTSIVLDDLTKVFAVLSEAYGILWVTGDSLALTVVGSRVLLHLLDARIFIEETTALAARLAENPKES